MSNNYILIRVIATFFIKRMDPVLSIVSII